MPSPENTGFSSASPSRDIVLEGAVEVVSTTAVPVVYTANSLIGDLMEQAATRDIAKELMAATGLLAASEDEPDDMMLALMKYMPLRGTVAFSQGKLRTRCCPSCWNG
ncbi:hypothetical protein HMSSN036_81050 [Paenibacillus macerans]|nr:hypothetical protein HMSSN036_81050 [Paenibacillus macerans]